MKKKSIKIIIASILGIIIVLNSAPVNKEIAKKIALNWFSFQSIEKVSNLDIQSTEELVFNNETGIYAINFKNSGFVIVSADDIVKPILAYSLENIFNNENSSPAVKSLIQGYQEEINYAKENYLSDANSTAKWKNILDNKFDGITPLKDGKAVDPLIDALWNQQPPYSNYCPEEDGDLCVVGCVSTAMSMIMRYHQFPTHGTGSHSYYWQGNQLSADFGSNVYRWDLMPTTSAGMTPEQEHEVAQICYDAGIAVNMDYGSGGSSASSQNWVQRLPLFFNYQTPTYVQRSGYSMTQWNNLLKDEIDSNRPIYYRGQGDGGHAFICDGYDDSNLFHFNFGWAGSDNGYYVSSALNTSNGSFNVLQACIINIIPGTEDVLLNENIEDIMISELTVINLDDYFESSEGNNITYSIDENTNPTSVLASISGSSLTLDKGSENGLANLKIIAQTSEDQFFDRFDVKSIDEKPLAGYGNSYNFSGESYIDAGNNDILNEMEVFSFTAWVKLNSLGINHSIISKNTSTNNGIYFNINTINKIKFYIKGLDGSSRKIYSSSTLDENVWIHLAGTYDGQVQRIYIDGFLDKEEIHDDYQAIQPIQDQNLLLGRSVSYYSDCSIDDVRLWNKELNELEVVESMGNELLGTENGLISYWQIDENFSNEISDVAGNNHANIQLLNNLFWQTSTVPVRYCSFGSTVTGFLPANNDGAVTFELVDNSGGNAEITNTVTGEFTFNPSSSSTDNFTYKTVKDGTDSEIITVIVDNDLVDVDDNNELQISKYELKQNYPNPFNPVTKINYELRITNYKKAEIVVFNTAGQQVWSSGDLPFTIHHSPLYFDGSKFNSGIYYYSLIVDGKKMSTKSMVLIK